MGNKKKTRRSPLCKLRDQGSGACPENPVGLGLEPLFVAIEESKVTFLLQNPYQDVQTSNIQSLLFG